MLVLNKLLHIVIFVGFFLCDFMPRKVLRLYIFAFSVKFNNMHPSNQTDSSLFQDISIYKNKPESFTTTCCQSIS